MANVIPDRQLVKFFQFSFMLAIEADLIPCAEHILSFFVDLFASSKKVCVDAQS
jgi:hypothetical protein